MTSFPSGAPNSSNDETESEQEEMTGAHMNLIQDLQNDDFEISAKCIIG